MGWKSDELLIVLRKPVGGNTKGGKKNRARHQTFFCQAIDTAGEFISELVWKFFIISLD